MMGKRLGLDQLYIPADHNIDVEYVLRHLCLLRSRGLKLPYSTCNNEMTSTDVRITV